MQYLTIWDLLLTPVYLIILIAIAKRHRDKNYPIGHPLRKYYMPGLYAKFGGAIFIGSIYAFYYGGGDTFNYFSHAIVINSSFVESPAIWWKLITHSSVYQSPEIYPYVSKLFWYNAPSEYNAVKITAIISLFTNTTYFPTSLLFAYLSYTGIWAMYRTFAQLYPKYTKSFAYAFLFFPSIVVWGSGIFKDTICMFGLGWMTYATFRLFVNRDFSIKNILYLILSFYLISNIKLYILLGFLPALMLWLLLSYSKKIEAAGLRWIVNLLFIGLTMAIAFFFMQRFANELNKFSLEKLAKTAETNRDWTNFAAGDEGSTYDIGKIDGTLSGTLGLFPKAVAVTLFRPFPWEVRKVIVGLSAIEALVIVYFTLQMLFSKHSKKLSTLFRDPNVLFCLAFTIIFAFAVGASSGNFGALSRYKIPCLPFYGAVLAIMLAVEDKKPTAKRSVSTQHVQPAI
ncbi:MAG: hypothetical protein C4329_06830 [Chitinophagaceae bacterium]